MARLFDITAEHRRLREVSNAMKSVVKLKRLWRHFAHGEPGRRFQDRYQRGKGARERGHMGWRIVKVIAGGLAVAIGIVELVFPGPAILFLLIGGSLLATESLSIAKTMDWLEVGCRRVAAWAKAAWCRFSRPTQYVVAGVMGVVGVAGALVVYRALSD